MIQHPTDTGPTYQDQDGNPAQLVQCPDCGQMEWWTLEETQNHGKCRASNKPCWCEESRTQSPYHQSKKAQLR
jgi:hypothetical protein